MLGVDASGTVVWATRGAHSLLGLVDGQLVGKSWAGTFADGVPELPADEREPGLECERGPRRQRLKSFVERTADGLVEHLSPVPTFDLFEEALGALDLAERLQQMSTALSATGTLSEALDVFIEHALPALGGRSGAVALPSRDRTCLEFVEGARSHTRVPEQYQRIPIHPESALGHAWTTGETVWLAEGDEVFPQSVEPLAPLGIKRVAIVPMRVGAGPVGLLVFEVSGGELDSARKRYAEAVAQACAHAFESARLAEEERHMQAVIAASERRMRDITSSAPLLVWMQDPTGRITWINEERAFAYFGVGLDKLATNGMAWVHPDDLPPLHLMMAEQMANRSSYELELRLRRHDGVYRWHLVRAEARTDEATGQFHWYGSATDIDDQKRIRNELVASEQKLRLALLAGRMLAWEYDVESDVLTTTANEKETGISPPGPRLLDMVREDIHPDDQEETHRRFLDAIAREVDFEATFRRRFADGSWHWLESRATCIRDAEGKVVGLLGVSRDVNEEKRAELRLRSSEEMFRTVSQTLPVIVWTETPEGDSDFFNTRFWRYTGLREEALLPGDHAAEYVHPDDLAALQRMRKQSLRHETPWEIEFRLRRHDGTWRWHLGRSVPVLDETGELILWVGSATDIDDQKRVLAEREELLSRTQDAVRGREVFLAVAAHELRTPLTPLRLHVDTLLRAATSGGDVPPSRFVRGLEVASRQIKRLQLLVEALLDVSRIASGRLELQHEALDLTQVAQDVLDRHRHEGPPEQLTLTAEGDLVGWLDRLRIEQILTNLLTNAFRYGQRNPVHVALEGRGDQVRLSVRDEGVGIAPADKQRIFERFERAGDNLPQGGLGLGLWIVHQIVVAMGGSIHVESEVGRGSTFVVDLPRGNPPVD